MIKKSSLSRLAARIFPLERTLVFSGRMVDHMAKSIGLKSLVGTIFMMPLLYVAAYLCVALPEPIGFDIVVPSYRWTTALDRSCSGWVHRPMWKYRCEAFFRPLTKIDPRIYALFFNPGIDFRDDSPTESQFHQTRVRCCFDSQLRSCHRIASNGRPEIPLVVKFKCHQA